MVTGWMQALYYGIIIRAGDPKPQPGSPRYVNDRRRIHIAVVSAYLLYTVYEAHHDISRNLDFYRLLGLPQSASERDIKSRFRRLAAVYHPDKVAPTANSDDFFRLLKTAQDTLLNPAARFAYERFGPQVTSWRNCTTIRDYLSVGIQQTIPYYGAGAIFMYILGLLGYLQWGTYWRWLTLVSLAVAECAIVARPYMPKFASHFINPLITTMSGQPPYLQFQLIELLRKLSVTLYIAFSQIGPLLSPPQTQLQMLSESEQLDKTLNLVEQSVHLADKEAERLMAMEMAPFVGDGKAVREVQGRVKEWLVQNTVRSDPMVRDALGNVLRRKREGVPSGARGTK